MTVLLYDGDLSGVALKHARSLGRASVNLFENAPKMPTLRDMHRIIAAHPTIQAKLFLFLEEVLIKELLCIEGAFIGRRTFKADGMPYSFAFEDDYASNGEPGLANFATALLAPEEAQGRGFRSHPQKSNGHASYFGRQITPDVRKRRCGGA